MLESVPIDQILLVVVHVLFVPLGFVFREALFKRNSNVTLRHIFTSSVGTLVLFIFYGREAFHLALQSVSLYFVIFYSPKRAQVFLTFLISFSYLLFIHAKRALEDYGGYRMDISGPLMISTQKLTALSMAYADGLGKAREDKNEKYRVKLAFVGIRAIPPFLTFLSYIFNFHGVLIGPFFHFTDYVRFVEGHNQPRDSGRAILRKCLDLALCSVVFLSLGGYSDPVWIFEKSQQIDSPGSLLLFHLYSYFCGVVTRFRYYFAWILSDIVHNSASFGFDEASGTWSGLVNVDILKVEFPSSLRETISHWNILTVEWLRFVVYSRDVPMKRFAVFMLSALWHGVYPGYYLMFVTLFLLSLAGISIYKWAVRSKVNRFASQLVQSGFAVVGVTYIYLPFLSLSLERSLKIYWAIGFWLHFVALGVALLP